MENIRMEKFRLDNKISMVTGGSKGIGFEIAKALAEVGSDIVLVARDKTNLDRAREELAGTGRNIRTRSFNMSAVEEIDERQDHRYIWHHRLLILSPVTSCTWTAAF